MNVRLIVTSIVLGLLVQVQASAQVIDCACDSEYSVGDRVITLVDDPSGASNLPAGTLGTVLCGDMGSWDLYISWDAYSDGHNANASCECQSGDDAEDNSHRLVLCGEVAPVQTHSVPGDFATIAVAIAAANNGDTIEIAAGTYNEHDIIFDKSITIQGAVDGNGEPTTIIDGESVSFIMNYDGSLDGVTGGHCTFENLLFRNGYNELGTGGGLATFDAGSTVRNCVFDSNHASYSGGLYSNNYSEDPTLIIDCRFVNNTADNSGGGLGVLGDDNTVSNCVFTGNNADDGGGMVADGAWSTTSILDCTFQGNSATDKGGGVWNFGYVDVTMDGCTISGNSAAVGGGVFHGETESTFTISNSTICDNTPDAVSGAYADGGGNSIHLYCPDNDGTLHVPTEYLTIASAVATAVDGETIEIAAGTYNEHDIIFDKSITIQGAVDGNGEPTTIIDGESVSFIMHYDGTLDGVDGGHCTFENLLFRNGYNEWGTGGGLFIQDAGSTVTNCVFDSNYGSYSGGLYSNNYSGDPTLVTGCRFVNNAADNSGGGLGVLGDDNTVSNCVFTGNNADDGGGMVADGAWSTTSILDCTFQGNSATDKGGGVWNYGYVDVTMDGCTISGNSAAVGGGVYHGETESTFTISNSTICDNTPDAVVGSYVDGGGNSIWNDHCPDDDGTLHVPTEYPTIAAAIAFAYDGNSIEIEAGTYYESGIDLGGKNILLLGEVNGDGSPAVTIDAQFIDTVIHCDSDAQFENLVITGGNADDGGGMYVSGSNPMLTNCTLTNNTAKNGGGMYNTGSSPSLIDCTISNNGALFWQAPDTGRGGGICNVSSTPSLTNTILSGNSATWGGAICNTGSSISTLAGCTVSSNIGKVSGGGVYSVLSSATLQDTEFCANSPTHLIGAWDDLGGNTFSDDCEPPPGLCVGDVNADYDVDVLDLLYVIAVWNTDNPAGDINEDGWVDVMDLLEVIGNWGECGDAD